MKHIATFTLLGLCTLAFGQNMQKEKLNIKYMQPPSVHIEAGLGYHSTAILDYKAEIDADLAAAEEEYQLKLAQYPDLEAASKAAHDELLDNYEHDIEAWNSKSSVGKMIDKKVLDNGKPEPPTPYYPPAKPNKRVVTHQKLFNTEQLASTYLRIEGSEQDENGVQIEIHLFGFENDEPVVVKTEYKEVNIKTKVNETKIKSFWTFKYRHSMSLRAVDPNGTIIFDEVPNVVADYKTYNSTEEKLSHPSSSAQSHVDKLYSKIVEDNMSRIQWMLNDKLGTTEQSRDIEVIYVKNKNGVYNDLETAMYDAKEGYAMLSSRPEKALEKLSAAIKAWEVALDEADYDDKKARINKRIAPDLYSNLILAYTMTQNFNKADDLYNASLRLDFANGDENNLTELQLLNNDLRQRNQK